MTKIIEARVRQKKDTLPNWMANTLVPLSGEQCFVVDGDGGGINFKIGDGIRTFADLPWFNIVINGESIVVVDNIANFRSLPQSILDKLAGGQLKGVTVLGYYTKGDTPAPIDYFISYTTDNDDWGSIIEVNGVKFEHIFTDKVDARYFGLKPYSAEDQSAIVQKVLDFGSEKLIKAYFSAGIYRINGRHNTGGRGMLIRSNSDIETDENTFFKVIPQVLGSYQAFALVDVENIYINRLNVIGEKDEHIAPVGVWLPWESNRLVNINEYVYFNNWGFKVLTAGNLSETKTTYSGLVRGDIVTNGTATLEVTNVSNVQEWVPGGGGTLGEWGMGISFLGAKNVNIDYFNASNFWGDGIYLGHSATRERNININITRADIYNTRRQGMSVENVDGLYIDTININKVSGTAPASGIDFEPLYETDAIKGVNINRVQCYDSDDSAVIFIGHFMGVNAEPIDIVIGEIVDYNCGALRVSGSNYEFRRKGLIRIDSITSNYAKNHVFQSISLVNGVDIELGDIYINNCNQSNLVYPFGAGIRVYSESSSVTPDGVPTNISINNIYSESTDGKMTNVIDVYEGNKGVTVPPIVNFNILGNVFANGSVLQNITYRIKTNGILNYKGLRPVLNSPTTISVTQSTVAKLSNKGRTSNTLYSLNNLPIGYKITIEVSDAYAVGIDNTFDFKLFHYSDLESRRLTSTVIGSYITISHLGNNIWDIDEMVGRWYYNIEILRNNVTITSTEKQGIIQLATQTEVNGGGNTVKAVTPSTLHNKLATTASQGLVKQSTNVANSTVADATDLTTAIALVNDLKTKLNAKLTADRNSGQQSTT